MLIEFDETVVSFVATGSPSTLNLSRSLASFKQANVPSDTGKSGEPNSSVMNTAVAIN